MVCSGCHQDQDHLIKTFVGSFKRHDDRDKLVTCRLLCRQCVVGNVLPVWRPSVECWQIGEVAALNEHSGKHHIIFLDETDEWVIVEKSPYDDYVAHHRGRARQGNIRYADRNEKGAFQQRGQQPLHSHEKENERLMKKAAKRLAVNQEEGRNENVDWSLRRVTDSSVVSPVRVLDSNSASRSIGFMGFHDSSPAKVTGPEKPKTSLGIGYPPLHPGHGTFMKDTKGSPATLRWGVENSDNHRRPGPRMWTFEEDTDLIKCVEAASVPIKWPVIAASIAGRSGKQCRERYLNHLKPKLNTEEWTAVEDALLFRMYTLFGTKWAFMRKALPGRTDNRIKNRFHFLRRRVEKDAAKFLEDNKAKPDKVHSSSQVSVKDTNSSASNESAELSDDPQTKIRDMLPYLAKETLKKSDESSSYSFGPFRQVQGDVCKRCNLTAPSLQTGRTMCKATGWCEACTRLPPYVNGSLVCECLNLRKTGDETVNSGDVGVKTNYASSAPEN